MQVDVKMYPVLENKKAKYHILFEFYICGVFVRRVTERIFKIRYNYLFFSLKSFQSNW